MAAPPAVESAVAGARAANYETIVTMADLQRWIARLQAAELIALHIEAASFDYMEAEIIGLAFCVEPASRLTCRWRTTTPARLSNSRQRRSWRL